jgi:hypothetical protein
MWAIAAVRGLFHSDRDPSCSKGVRLEKPSSRREVTTTALMPLVPEPVTISCGSREISRPIHHTDGDGLTLFDPDGDLVTVVDGRCDAWPGEPDERHQQQLGREESPVFCA